MIGWILVLYLHTYGGNTSVVFSPILNSKQECENFYKIVSNRNGKFDEGHICVAVTKSK